MIEFRRDFRLLAATVLVAGVGCVAVVGCSAEPAAPAKSSGSTIARTPTEGPAPLDVSTPTAFVNALERGAAGMGQCDVRQQRQGDQFKSHVEMSIEGPVAAKVDLSPRVAAERQAASTIVTVAGKAYATEAGSDNRWRAVAVQPVSVLAGEMDCRSVFKNLEAAALSVKASSAGDVGGRSAQRYEVQYDTKTWASSVGDAETPETTDANMTVSVIDGRLAQLQIETPEARSTEYLWFPGAPDVVAPPADVVTK